MSVYPARPQLFAVHYIRWMIESGTASEAGPDAFALLVAVAMQEDQIRYARPPNFYNEQLCRHCGIGSEPALIRARKRAIKLGLLEYEPGAKRRPGRYFVSGFPNDSLGKAKGIRRESEGNPTPSNPNPIPNPKDTCAASLSPEFKAFWEAYPPRKGKRLGKSDAAKAFAKVAPEDHADLMRAVSLYRGTCGDFAKDASRFLKGDFWRDVLETATTTTSPPTKQLPQMPTRGSR